MTIEEIHAKLEDRFGEAIEGLEKDEAGRAGLLESVIVKPEALPDVCRFVHDEAEIKLDFLDCITATDFEDSIHVAYVVTSTVHKHQIAIKVKLDREQPVVGTVEKVWRTADWHEREAYDLVGVHFEGHSNLTRLMMPDDWVGHPLRKDYKEEPDYKGVPTTRENSLGKY